MNTRKLAIISFALLPVLSGCGFLWPDDVSETAVEEPAAAEPAEPAEPRLPWDDLEPFDPGRRVSADLEDLLPDVTEFSYGGEGRTVAVQ